MYDAIFIATGHGYETSSRGRCTAFDGFDVIAEPLGGFDDASRASRVFPRNNGLPGVTYASHAIKLARKDGRGLYILMQHGGGREVLRLPDFYDDGAMVEAWLQMPPAALYATLYTIYDTARRARDAARDAERLAWMQAHADKRIRQRTYRATGTAKVWIEPKREPGESDESFEVRKVLAAPSKR